MEVYTIIINQDALLDIQEATNWYNERLPKLGGRFQKSVKQHINNLKSNADGYSIRYSNVRCMLVKKFPFLIHFVIDDIHQVVEVYAVFHTSRNPQIWNQRNKIVK